jgi:hypothetical protein
MTAVNDSPLMASRRRRREWSTLSEGQRRARARKDQRQLSMFGPEHTQELRMPQHVKDIARRGFSGQVIPSASEF